MTAQRDFPLDVLKGLCVLGMVVHHCLEGFPVEVVQLKYFRFVSGAFLFLAGFVSTNIYFKRYMHPGENRKAGRRLIWRGIRLLLIVVVANMVLALIPGASLKAKELSLTRNLYNFFWGGSYQEVTFALLVPIGYLLMAVGILLLVFRFRRKPFFWIAGVFFLFSSTVYFSQENGYYFRYFTIGLVGAVCGLFHEKTIRRNCDNLSAASLLYFCSLISLAFFPMNFPFYACIVILTLFFLYALCMKMSPQEWIARKTSFIGNYTLISYLVQILILRLLGVWLSKQQHTEMNFLLAVLLTTLLMVLFIEVLHRLRKRYSIVNGLYKAVFG